MAIPDYQSIMLPLLDLAGDGNEHSLREAYEQLAKTINATNIFTILIFALNR